MGSVGSVGFLVDFEYSMAVLGVGRGPVEFIAPLSFKWLDSQPVKSNMSPDPIDVYDFHHFQKSCRGFLARYLSCFETCRRKIVFSSFPVGTKKNRDKELRRFVVVSSREVPSLRISCPFKILSFRSFSNPPLLFHSKSSRKSVH